MGSEVICSDANKAVQSVCEVTDEEEEFDPEECQWIPPKLTFECVTAIMQCPEGQKIECFLFASFGQLDKGGRCTINKNDTNYGLFNEKSHQPHN